MAVGDSGVRGPGAAWTSTDGKAWQATNGTAALVTITLDTVVQGSSSIIAFGANCAGSGECGGSNELTFDGHIWTFKGSLLGVDGKDHGAPSRFASIHGSLIGVESEQVGSATPVVYAGRVWTSPDGETWTLEPDDPVFVTAQLNDVAAGPGGLVAVGSVASTSALATNAAIWQSADGRSWTRLSDQPTFSDAAIYAVIAAPPGYVAVGRGAVGAEVWTSSDGRSWTRVPDQAPLHDAAMYGLAQTKAGLTAVGYGRDSAAIWTSTDGLTWARVPDGPAFSMAQAVAIAVKGDAVVVVGGANGETSPEAIIWSDH